MGWLQMASVGLLRGVRFDGKLVNWCYRVTNLESSIGKYLISVNVSGNVSGYVEPSDIELVDIVNGH